MKLVWTEAAATDLEDIVTYIWFDSPPAAKKIRQRVEATALYLRSQPFMGRIGAMAGTREALAHPSYKIVYQVNDETVSILRVVHTSRQWPPADEELG